jgi:hypothetical protein
MRMKTRGVTDAWSNVIEDDDVVSCFSLIALVDAGNARRGQNARFEQQNPRKGSVAERIAPCGKYTRRLTTLYPPRRATAR